MYRVLVLECCGCDCSREIGVNKRRMVSAVAVRGRPVLTRETTQTNIIAAASRLPPITYFRIYFGKVFILFPMHVNYTNMPDQQYFDDTPSHIIRVTEFCLCLHIVIDSHGTLGNKLT